MPQAKPLLTKDKYKPAAHSRPLSVRASHFFGALLLFGVLPALACPYPDEGTMPLRRALTRVQMLPEALAWERERREAGELVQYRLLLEQEKRVRGRCYWTVEALAGGEVWKRFYVTPDGRSILREKAR